MWGGFAEFILSQMKRILRCAQDDRRRAQDDSKGHGHETGALQAGAGRRILRLLGKWKSRVRLSHGKGARDEQRAGAAISAGVKPRPSGSPLRASKRGEKSGLAVGLCSTTEHAPAVAGLRTTPPAFCLLPSAYCPLPASSLLGGWQGEGDLPSSFYRAGALGTLCIIPLGLTLSSKKF